MGTLHDKGRGRPAKDGLHYTSPAAIVADVLSLSDERDRWERLCLAAFREGWRAAEHAHAHDYSLGYVDGLFRRKHIEHSVVDAAKLELARWGPGGRERFADPRPGDFPGRGVTAA